MSDGEKLSLEQIQAFLDGTGEIHFAARNQREIYAWVDKVLREQGYTKLKRKGKERVLRFIGKGTCLSRAQVTRLVAQYVHGIYNSRSPMRCAL